MVSPSSGAARTVVVCGASGRQGGAVARHLVRAGWRVVGLTRDPESERSGRLRAMGVDVVQGDMSDRPALERTFAGAHGVFSVQNPMIAGFQGEIDQGRNVADAAKSAGVAHLVYGSAGMGRETGVPSWDTKVAIARHIGQIGMPATILRPMAFMELMSHKDLYPAVAMWSVMPKLAGADTRIPWLAADDVGAIAARVFDDPSTFVGRDIPLAADARTVEECRAMWRETQGSMPRRFPIPVWLFERMPGPASKDLPRMWRWLRSGSVPLDTTPTREIHPGALTVREWLVARRGPDANE